MRKPRGYTLRELAQFDRLTMMCSSQNQMERIKGRLRTNEFVEKHGEEKCRRMFEILRKRDKRKQR